MDDFFSVVEFGDVVLANYKKVVDFFDDVWEFYDCVVLLILNLFGVIVYELREQSLRN